MPNRRIAPLLPLLALGCSPPVDAALDEPVQALMRQGEQAEEACDRRGAEAAYRSAAALARDGRSAAAARPLSALGRVYTGWLRFDEAEAALGEADALFPRVRASATERAQLLRVKADLLEDRDRFDEAEALLAEARALDPPSGKERAADLSAMAYLYRETGRLDQARRAMEEALSLERGAEKPNDLRIAEAMKRLSWVLIRANDDEGAREVLDSGLALAQAATEQSCRQENIHAGLVHSLALTHLGLGRPSDAEPLLRMVLAHQEALYGVDDPHTGVDLYNLASAVQGQGRLQEAAALFERTLAIETDGFGEAHSRLVPTCASLAHVREALGDEAGAEVLFRRAVAIWEGGRQSSPDGVAALGQLGDFYRRHGRPAEAEPILRRALAAADGQPLWRDNVEWQLGEIEWARSR